MQGGMKMNRKVSFEVRRSIPKSWNECLAGFLSWKTAQGAAPKTLQGHKEIISIFFRRFPDAWSADCRERIAQFLAQDGIAAATYNIRLKSLAPFFEFAAREGVFNKSPASDFRMRKGESSRIVDHPMGDLKNVLNIIGTETFAGLRDTALFIISIDTGIRPSEALQLLPSDIDFLLGRAAIRASTSKTRTARVVYFSEKTAELIEKLILVRPKEWHADVPVFCTSYGTPWNTHSWTVQLRRYAQKAGLKRLSAYDLRHQHAIEYLRNGGDVFTLQKGMGHSTLAMTERYLAISNDDLKRAHEKASPALGLFSVYRKRLGKIQDSMMGD